MKANTIHVYAGWENDAPIGTLYCDTLSGKEVISFEFYNSWLNTHPHLNLDPTLPPVPYRSYSSDKMLFGAFQDSCPDRWGRKLIDRREAIYAAQEGRRPHQFFDSEYMLSVQDACRSGGFRFKTDEDGCYLDNDSNAPIPPITSIRELEQISLGYENGMDERWVHQLVAPGSSLGGARPKANVQDTDGSLWIAKFPSRNDDYDIGAWEKTVHDLAKACGIIVPESKVCRYSDLGSTFLVKRFDRDDAGNRIHFASAMTMLGLRDGAADGVGYLELAEITSQISKQAENDLEQLFRRVVFDIAVSNQDNHLRNHGFLLSKNQWLLSPAFDMNPVNNAEFLALNIDETDGYRSFEKAMATHPYYHLSHQKALEIVKDISGIVAETWRTLAKKHGIQVSEQKRLSPAFKLSELQAMKDSI